MFGNEKFFSSGASASSGTFYPYEINNSLKFEDGDSSYLSRTPASVGNRKTFTWSGWFKRANLTNSVLLSAGTSNTARTLFYFDATNGQLYFFNNASGTVTGIYTSAYYRDVSSFYHVVLAVDTTQTNASDRAKIYINGVEQAVSTYIGAIALNADLYINATNAHGIGAQAFGSAIYSDGYLTEVNFIDGTALDPTSFGETKEGIWIPKQYSGSYGTNGFYLPFKETTSANGFNTVTYTGNHATQSVDGVGFQPDMIWLKSRSQAYDHVILDSVRGVKKELIPNKTDAERTRTDCLDSFDADGFTMTLGLSTSYNNSPQTYVAWCWGGGTNDKTYTVTVVNDGGNKYRFDGHGTSSIALNLTEGATYTFNYPSAHPLRFSTTSDGTHNSGSEYTTGVTHVSSTQTTITVASGAPVLYYYCSIHSGMGGQVNTNTTDGPTHAEGTILSRVKPNAEYGFSIVSYTGTGSAATVGHGLGVAPKMVIIKDRGDTSTWIVYTEPTGNDNVLVLASNQAAGSTGNFNSTSPTSTVFSQGGGGAVGASSSQYIAYCFSDVTNHQKIGSYIGNGSTTGPTVTLGFRPSFLLIKRTDSTGEWILMDNTRHPSNPNDLALFARLNYAETSSSSYEVDFNSDGFQLKNTNSAFNASGGTYIYLAIADTRDALFTSDASGNGNHWTPNALQHSDIMPDTPTNGFSTLNVIETLGANGTFSEGNLKVQTTNNGDWDTFLTTLKVSSGKWYAEVLQGGSTSSSRFVGVSKTNPTTLDHLGRTSDSYAYYGSGTKYNNNTSASYGAAYNTGDIVGILLDLDAGQISFSVNGSDQGVAYSGLTGEYYFGVSFLNTAQNAIINFGQDSSFNGTKIPQGNTDDNGKGDFFYAPPSGYLALCNANLPDPAIDPNKGDNPENHFNTVLWTGDGSDRNIDVGFKSDFVWVKERNNAVHHRIYDSVRGDGKTIFSSLGNAEYNAAGDGIHFDYTNGFNIDYGSNGGSYNGSSDTYVAWNWKADGTAVANTDGDINTNVSVNDDAGFSIISYTGNGSGSTQTIGHGLSTKPDFAIIKNLTQGYNWMVLFDIIDGSYDFIQGLNTTSAKTNGSGTFATTSTLSLLSGGNLNGSGDNFICYCFSPKEGYSKFGSYTGNASTDGPFVYTGFRPAFVMLKRTDSAANWTIIDNTRSTHNVVNKALFPDLSTSEQEGTSAGYTMLDFLSNGFKYRQNTASHNASGGTFIYMALAEQPFKYSNAR